VFLARFPRHELIIIIQQDRFGKELTALETQWTNLISSVLQIEMANVALEAELERLHLKESELGEIA
jgi:pre-mRNA-splicing factor SPF27